MFLIAGLGNPDKRYEKTRHNVGFDAVDVLAGRYGIAVKEKKHRALVGTGYIEGVKVILAKPQTYMNLSGESLAEIVNFYKLDAESEMLVVFDDISLAPGSIRVRKKGSAGGHNGIKSIISCLGTSGFMRIKIGVGEKPEGWDLADYVLSRFPDGDRVLAEAAMKDAADAAVLMVQGFADKAMNEFNAKKRESKEG